MTHRRWAMWCGVAALGFTFSAAAGLATAADWTQFRGPKRDNQAPEKGLYRQWPAGGPKVLWSVDVGPGYAGPAVLGQRVYLNDYRVAKEPNQTDEWCVRCLDLASGHELWRHSEAKKIRANHGITRTAPCVDAKYVFSLDPKCVFHCLDITNGHELWHKDLVTDYQATIPPWYNGQCPLMEADRIILGVGGSSLMVALDKATGKELWRTPNPEKWPLSHASVMPAELGGVKQYLWCTLAGVVGVAADDGRQLWFYPRKFNVAVAPAPLPIGTDRVFVTAGYDAGSTMLRVRKDGEKFVAEPLFELTSEQWNSEVHTPILLNDHLYAVGKKERGLFSCVDLSGKIVWDSAGKASFGLGSFLYADGMFFILDGDTGMLRLLEANTTGYKELAAAQVLNGTDVWGPMALTGNKLVLRDMNKLVCIEVGPAQ